MTKPGDCTHQGEILANLPRQLYIEETQTDSDKHTLTLLPEEQKGGPVLLRGAPHNHKHTLETLECACISYTHSSDMYNRLSKHVTPTYVSVCISKLCVLPQLHYTPCKNAKL